MSIRTQLGGSIRGLGAIDTATAVLALVIGLSLLPLQFYTSTIFAVMLPVAIVTGSGLYLLTRRYGYEDRVIDHVQFSASTGHLLRLAVGIGLAGMVFVGSYTGGRTVPFYAVAVVVYSLLLARILLVESGTLGPGRTLAEIVLFALVLRGVALLTTTGLVGVDIWVHLPNYAAALQESGRLSAISQSKYYGAPLYHLLVVTAAEAFNSSLRVALYATLGVVVPLSALFIYLTSTTVMPTRWALFATAAFAISDRFVLWGIHLIPTSMGLVFFLGVVFLTAAIAVTDRRRPLYALALLFGIATVLTHQISAFVLLVFLGAGVAAQLALRYVLPRIGVDAGGDSWSTVRFDGLLAVLAPVTAVDWYLSPPDGTSFLVGMVRKGASRVQSISPPGGSGVGALSDPVAAVATTVPSTVEGLFALGLTVLLLVSLVGAFALLRDKRLGLLPLTWVIATAVMLVVALGMPLLELEVLVPSRWLAFLYVPMVLLAAHGMWHLKSAGSPRQFLAVVAVFLLVFTGPMLVNHKATIEQPVFEDAQLTPAYSEAELDAADTIAAIHPDGERVKADRPYFLLLRDRHRMDARSLTLLEDGTVGGTHVVYRQALGQESPMVRYGDGLLRVELQPDAVCRPGMGVAYTNGDVRYCVR